SWSQGWHHQGWSPHHRGSTDPQPLHQQHPASCDVCGGCEEQVDCISPCSRRSWPEEGDCPRKGERQVLGSTGPRQSREELEQPPSRQHHASQGEVRMKK